MDKLFSFLCTSFNLIGGNHLLSAVNRTPRILFYHGVSSDLNIKLAPENFHVDEFTKQISYLKHYYEVISLDEFYYRFNLKKFTGKEVVITFDDGYANNLYEAAPILSHLNLPYAVFISTEHVETGDYFPTAILRMVIWGTNLKIINIPSLKLLQNIDTFVRKIETNKIISRFLKHYSIDKVKIIVEELLNNLSDSEKQRLFDTCTSLRPMNWREVAEIINCGSVTIGSHCKYHICCHANQKRAEVNAQIRDSKTVIEEKLGISCNYFAFPNGDYTMDAIEAVKDAGYKMAFSIKGSNKIINANPFLIPRIGVPRDIEKFKIYMAVYPYKKND